VSACRKMRSRISRCCIGLLGRPGVGWVPTHCVPPPPPPACHCFDAFFCWTAPCCAVLCCAVLCCAVLCCAVLCCAVCCQKLHAAHIGIMPNVLPCPKQPQISCCRPATAQGSSHQCMQKHQHVATVSVGHQCLSSSCAITCTLSVLHLRLCCG